MPSEATTATAAPDLTSLTLRIARPTNDLSALLPFYRDGLGFTLLSSFDDHAGFSGVMLGRPGSPYHFEFTSNPKHDAGRAPSQDNLLVFYIPERDAWEAAVARMERAGHEAVASLNPWWEKEGRTFEDADGYRIVLQNGSWAK